MSCSAWESAPSWPSPKLKSLPHLAHRFEYVMVVLPLPTGDRDRDLQFSPLYSPATATEASASMNLFDAAAGVAGRKKSVQFLKKEVRIPPSLRV